MALIHLLALATEMDGGPTALSKVRVGPALLGCRRASARRGAYLSVRAGQKPGGRAEALTPHGFSVSLASRDRQEAVVCPHASLMHELAIAQSVLEAVQTEAQLHPGSFPVKVAVRIGELSGVNPEALAFGFEALTKGTEWERLALEVEACRGGELELAYLELEES